MLEPRPAGLPGSTVDPASQPAAPGGLVAPAPGAASAAAALREQHLFRHTSSAGQVHPLRHLLKRYRAGERA